MSTYGLGMDSYVGGGLAYAPQEKMARVPTLQERLDLALQQAQEQLALVREAREILQRNPDLEKLLDLLQKARF